MTFGYDICTYLLAYHREWDKTVVPNGFALNISRLDVHVSDTGITDSKQDVIYLNQVPDTKTDCVCVYDTGGYSADHSYKSCSVLDKPTAQIRVRNKSLEVAEKTAYAIFILLDEVCYESINNHYYLKISVNNPPTFLSKDQITTNATAYEFTLNLNSMTKRR